MTRKVFYTFIIVLICGACSNSTDDYIKELNSDNPITRRIAGTKLMGRKNDPETTKKIVALLDSDNERLVFLATQILGALADTTAMV